MDGDERYSERLWPAWWAWPLSLVPAVMVAVAYGAALGATAGWLVAAVGIGLTLLLLFVTAPRIDVSSAGLSVDGALLPPSSVGSVEAVDAARLAALRGPGADARVFVALRPWSTRDGVLVTLDDADDPHPAWLFTSRHPARVVAALTATMTR